MNPNIMNRNVCYYGANRGRMNNCDTNCGNMQTPETDQNNNCGCMPSQDTNRDSNCGCMPSRNTNRECSCGCMPSRNMNRDCSCGCMPSRNTNKDSNCGCMNHENTACNQYGQTDCRELESMNRQQLLSYLNQVSFSMYDTTLFLDTHPCDQKALAYFKEMQHARKHALKIYQKKFGPLLLDNTDTDCEWTWGMQPLPWEPVC